MSQTAEHPIDAYSTTGTSPTLRILTQNGSSAQEWRRAYGRVHLLGPGAVGRELLQRLARDRYRLVAVTDSSSTIAAESGLNALDVVSWKQRGLPLREHPLSLDSAGVAAIGVVDADILIDTSSSDLARADWTNALDAALRRGVCLISAAKAALSAAGAEWLSGDHRDRIGCNAVLGGTGRSFLAELDDLRARTQSVAIVGNASTTAIIEALENGGTLREGIADAGRRGFLEPDPELDLRGADAAIKLAIVAGILAGRRIDPRDIPCDDIRNLDAGEVLARTRRNETTRLVARWRDGRPTVQFEGVSRDSVLATPCGRVVYEYRLSRSERRIHIGTGLGAAATADAVWSDLQRIARLAAQATARQAVAR